MGEGDRQANKGCQSCVMQAMAEEGHRCCRSTEKGSWPKREGLEEQTLC